MRLDRFVADNSKYSRSEVKQLIKAGRIRLNGVEALKANTHIKLDSDTVKLDEQRIEARGQVYAMLHKPSNVVCASTDADYPTAIDCLSDQSHFVGSDEQYCHVVESDLQIVGRLDKDTTGLLLLTTDGEWNHRITSPHYHCNKSYIVELAEPIKHSDIDKFRCGLSLKNDSKQTRPATLEILSEYCARVTLAEGRYHQVKRMFAAVGNRVVKLHRESIGPLCLNDQLETGMFRMLTQQERSFFQQSV